MSNIITSYEQSLIEALSLSVSRTTAESHGGKLELDEGTKVKIFIHKDIRDAVTKEIGDQVQYLHNSMKARYTLFVTKKTLSMNSRN